MLEERGVEGFLSIFYGAFGQTYLSSTEEIPLWFEYCVNWDKT